MSQVTQNSIDDLIATGKRQFQQLFSNSTVHFADPVWDAGFLQTRLVSGESLNIFFTRWGSTTDPLPAFYSDVVKSWLLLQESGIRTWQEKADAARVLWEQLQQRHERFAWFDLCEEDVRQTELWLRERYAKATTYARTNAILQLARFLDSRQICRPLYYSVQTPCPSKAIFTEEARTRRRQRLPSSRALEGLADVYGRLAQTPQDRLRAAAVAILAVTGFRVGELVTLPVDCEVQEKHAGRQAYGLRYFKEKAKTAGKAYDVRWLTPLQAELAQQAVSEIRQLTLAARQRAKVLEACDPVVPIPNVRPTDKLSAADVARILGLRRPDNVHNTLAHKYLPRYGREKKYYFLGKGLAAYLQQKRVKHLWTVNLGNGQYQMLSESLFVVFYDFFFPNRRTLTLLVEPMRKGHINSFLTSHGEGRSIFERFDIRETDGAICRMTSHQFRHWLNDLAAKGGLTTNVLTRWMGRDNPRDTDMYKHATMDERLAWVREGIQAGDLIGAMSGAYFELPVEERHEFLDGQLQAVHFTPMGLCLHDFAIEPCPYHLNCVRGCPDYLRRKGDRREYQYLQRLKVHTEQALDAARQQTRTTPAHLAEAWVRHHQETLDGIQKALAVDEDDAQPSETMVAPNNRDNGGT